MPRKTKPRKPVTPPDQVWIAPRPANLSQPRTFEPIGTVSSNRYLEFADIALGMSKRSRHRNKKHGAQCNIPRDQAPDGKVTSIDSARNSNQGFGAFRNSR